MSVWPPPGATAVDITDAYPRLAARDYHYGPAFHGLQAMWRRGNEIFADIAPPDTTGLGADGFGIHPALLDAALHAGLLTAAPRPGDDAAAVLLGRGCPARRRRRAVRARIAPTARTRYP